MVSSDHIDCVCRHFVYTFWAIQLHVGVATVQVTDKFHDQPLGSSSKSVSVNDAKRTVLGSLFLTWMSFCVAFSTVLQAFLTAFLNSFGYKQPIKNMDELFASGIKHACAPDYSFIFENGDEIESLKVQRNRVNCQSYDDCLNQAKYQKNISILLLDMDAEEY